ncbi:FecR family protein [Pseudopedobacter beijingensis]|uniref:FecR family protein n=1 Tax=Pseudopedobacter beijingensis TaxID=1207056 RepID=A0ABW4I7W1_9SPHI
MIRLKELFNKYLMDECTAEEIGLLFGHFSEAKDESMLKKLIADALDQIPYNGEEEILSDQKVLDMYQNIQRQIKEGNKVSHLWRKIAVAASVLVFMSLGIYLFLASQQSVPQTENLVSQDVLSDGNNKAVLTLADGSKIILEDIENGVIANEGASEISKTSEGQLVYNTDRLAKDNNIKYNEIAVPRGGEYRIVLPDGTKVWLNSSSALKYPAQFIGQERSVELIGEGYFEVAKNTKQPFKVKVKDMEVQVLGTHFNVSAYQDDTSIITTLLEGSVNISGKTSHAKLKPGEQSVYANHNIEVSAANIEEAIAWKNGYFRFNNEDIESIMKKVSRWYDVEVEYRGDVKGKTFWGTFSRTKSISELLANLELTESIKFKIVPGDASGKGRRVIVMQ